MTARSSDGEQPSRSTLEDLDAKLSVFAETVHRNAKVYASMMALIDLMRALVTHERARLDGGG